MLLLKCPNLWARGRWSVGFIGRTKLANNGIAVFLGNGHGNDHAPFLAPSFVSAHVFFGQLGIILLDQVEEDGTFPARVGLVSTMPATLKFGVGALELGLGRRVEG